MTKECKNCKYWKMVDGFNTGRCELPQNAFNGGMGTEIIHDVPLEFEDSISTYIITHSDFACKLWRNNET